MQNGKLLIYEKILHANGFMHNGTDFSEAHKQLIYKEHIFETEFFRGAYSYPNSTKSAL